MRIVAAALVMTLTTGCVFGSRIVAGYGAIADVPGCGAALTIVAVVIDGALAAAMLHDGEVAAPEQVGLLVLGADVVVGGIDALQTCLPD